MNKKQRRGIIILAIVIVIGSLMGIFRNSQVTTIMPNVMYSNLADAIGTLEDAKIIENDDYINQIIIYDADNSGERLYIDDFLEYQKYTVVKQTPKAGAKYKFKPGLFVKSGTTDLTVLYVKRDGKDNNDGE